MERKENEKMIESTITIEEEDRRQVKVARMVMWGLSKVVQLDKIISNNNKCLTKPYHPL